MVDYMNKEDSDICSFRTKAENGLLCGGWKCRNRNFLR